MKELVVSIFANPSWKYYEYTVQAVLVSSFKGIEECKELEDTGAHTEREAKEMARIFVQTYQCMADSVWERF